MVETHNQPPVTDYVHHVKRLPRPLARRAILFLRQDTCNEIIPLTDRKEIWRRLLATLIKPMVTAEWWQKELDMLQEIVDEIPCYTMRFDQSGAVVGKLLSVTGH